MQNSDCLLLIVALLDNETIEKLATTQLWLTIREFTTSDFFFSLCSRSKLWYLRTQSLLEVNLEERQGDWREVYRYFERVMTVEDTDGNILHACAAIPNEITLLVVIELGYAYPNWSDDYPLRRAAADGYITALKLLLELEQVDPTALDNEAIQSSSKNGHTEIVRLLLEDGRVDPSADDSYALTRAAKRGHTEIVRLLLEDGRVDPSAENNYALVRASMNGHEEIVALLTQHTRDVCLLV